MPNRQSRPKRRAEKVERLDRKVSTSTRVLAVDELSAQEGLVLTEAQLVALEKDKTEKEAAL